MKEVVIIHGSYGNPEENWFPWLASEIRSLGHIARVPAFPTPENQSLKSWLSVFHEQVGPLTPETILVGHSLGPAFILNLLETATHPIAGTFLVSGFLGKLDLPEFDVINDSFVHKDFDWQYIRGVCGKLFLYHSDNDPYVPIAKAKELSEKLRTPLTLIPEGGHLNAQAGFTRFPQLLEDLRGVLD